MYWLLFTLLVLVLTTLSKRREHFSSKVDLPPSLCDNNSTDSFRLYAHYLKNGKMVGMAIIHSRNGRYFQKIYVYLDNTDNKLKYWQVSFDYDSRKVFKREIPILQQKICSMLTNKVLQDFSAGPNRPR